MTINVQQSIDQQVGAFVRNVSELIRRAAIEALERSIVAPAFSSHREQPRRTGTGNGTGKSKPHTAKKPAPPREPAELAALTERLYEAIAAQPGETMEVLAASVGCRGKQLRVSIEQLLRQDRVKKAGERRATRYFPMGADGR
jgi:hypothetical protein